MSGASTPADRLRILYQDVDDATAEYLRGTAAAACPGGCADCCRTKPPLVSHHEATQVLDALQQLEPQTLNRVRARARGVAVGLAQGAKVDFCCPLLEDNAQGVARCLVYAARPYACRTFGHTSRMPVGAEQPVPFSCSKLHAAVSLRLPPPVPFRTQAMRQIDGTVADSYLPVWIGLDPEERVEVASGAGLSVVVGRQGG